MRPQARLALGHLRSQSTVSSSSWKPWKVATLRNTASPVTKSWDDWTQSSAAPQFVQRSLTADSATCECRTESYEDRKAVTRRNRAAGGELRQEGQGGSSVRYEDVNARVKLEGEPREGKKGGMRSRTSQGKAGGRPT